ncbi:hypothetical protein [Caulobacter sp. DWP3-1-3b2]|uniref:hypothetical protein n=1 Tax=Caulobacter sp. DWP3-1-3b2 TaxID=2804643 RepID=UPI003CE8529C
MPDEIIGVGLTAFETYVAAAEQASREDTPADGASTRDHPLLNGAPYKAFRQAIGLAERRDEGTFFSGPAIATRLANLLVSEVPEHSLVVDPTCGMGDLLMAYADHLPLAGSLSDTIIVWGERLGGLDLREDLVRMTKVRLVMLARARGEFGGLVDEIDHIFPMIRVGSAMSKSPILAKADGFLFNPPFGQTTPAVEPTWSAGQINAAALFLDELLDGPSGPRPIAAVLPEVLRGGSRYGRFRDHLTKKGLGGTFQSLGRFDTWTDVDVFVTLLKAKNTDGLWADPVQPAKVTVRSAFVVRVGTVVPHRHEMAGPNRAYLCAKTTPAWDQAFKPTGSRPFSGTVFNPPFVVVRRTSSPSDRQRAVGTVIVGDEAVAVENHLIVAKPMKGGVDACRGLLDVLKSSETSEHLNRVLRCRHLTTGAVADIPWCGDVG